MRTRMAVFALLMCILPVSRGQADSFLITEGTWQTSPFRDAAVFDFEGPGIQAAGHGPARLTPTGLERLNLGEQISFRHSFSTEGGLGSADGQGFSLNSVTGNAVFQLFLTGEPITLPLSLSPSLTLQTAASLSGVLFLSDQLEGLTNQQQHSIAGSGTADVHFLEFDGGYRFTGMQVTFLPAVPEPGTLLLLGSGLVGLGACAAARRGKTLSR